MDSETGSTQKVGLANRSTSGSLPIIIVDEENLVRHAVAKMLSLIPGLQVIGEATSAAEALAALEKSKAALLITEINLPDMSGIELMLETKRRNLEVTSIVLSGTISGAVVQQALAAGALAYISKRSRPEEFLEAIAAVKAGRKFLSSNIGQLAAFEAAGSLEYKPQNDPLGSLSPREREIFHLLASGMQNTQIAKKLFISPRTVETHRARLVRKLGISTNPELIRFAIKFGLSSV